MDKGIARRLAARRKQARLSQEALADKLGVSRQAVSKWERAIVRIPDNPNRHASGNNIYTSTYTLFGKILAIRYVCCSCG